MHNLTKDDGGGGAHSLMTETDRHVGPTKIFVSQRKKNVGHLLANVSVGVNRLVEKAATVNQC